MSAFNRTLALSASVVFLAAGSADAQSSFNPPLDAPQPIATPVYVELTPGSRSDCVTTSSATGTPDQTQRTSFLVDTAPDGVRFTMTEQTAGLRVSGVVADDGTITVDDFSGAGTLPPEMQAQIEAIFVGVVESSTLHKRTLSQDEAFVEGQDVEALLGPILMMLGPDASATINGQQVVTGESMVDGRRVLVTRFEMDAVMNVPEVGEMTMVGSGVTVYDIATGLPRYDAASGIMELPPELGIAPVQIDSVMECVVTGG